MSRRPDGDSGSDLKLSDLVNMVVDEPDTTTNDHLVNIQLEQELDPVLGVVRDWVKNGRVLPRAKLRKLNRELRVMARLVDQLVLEDGILKRRTGGDEGSKTITLLPKV